MTENDKTKKENEPDENLMRIMSHQLKAPINTILALLQLMTDGYAGEVEPKLNEVFTPFYRSIKHKAGISGTGLGLPIARRVIEQHSRIFNRIRPQSNNN